MLVLSLASEKCQLSNHEICRSFPEHYKGPMRSLGFRVHPPP